MNTQNQLQEANIKIHRQGDKIESISINMPIWNKPSDDGSHLKVIMPLLGMDTIAKNDEDVNVAVDEAIMLFCLVAEENGQGVEKELQSIGWVVCDDNGEPLLGYNLDRPDEVLERIFDTGDVYSNELIVA